MAPKLKALFDPKLFLAKVGEGRTIADYSKHEVLLSQGDRADSIFYVQGGEVKLTVVSNAGKEAVIGISAAGDSLGEGCLTGRPMCLAAATAMSECSIVLSGARYHSAAPPRNGLQSKEPI